MTICNRSDASPSRLARSVADVVLADHVGAPSAAPSRPDRAASTPDPSPVTNVDDYVGRYYHELARTPLQVTSG